MHWCPLLKILVIAIMMCGGTSHLAALLPGTGPAGPNEGGNAPAVAASDKEADIVVVLPRAMQASERV